MVVTILLVDFLFVTSFALTEFIILHEGRNVMMEMKLMGMDVQVLAQLKPHICVNRLHLEQVHVIKLAEMEKLIIIQREKFVMMIMKHQEMVVLQAVK